MTWTCDYDFKLIMENVNTEEQEEQEEQNVEGLRPTGQPFEEPDILDSHLSQLTALREEVDGKLLILRVESERLHKLVDFYTSSLSKLKEET